MIIESLPFKGPNIRIPVVMLIKGKGFIHQGSTLPRMRVDGYYCYKCITLIRIDPFINVLLRLSQAHVTKRFQNIKSTRHSRVSAEGSGLRFRTALITQEVALSPCNPTVATPKEISLNPKP